MEHNPNAWGQLLVEYALTPGKAMKRRIISLVLSLACIWTGIYLFILWYESLAEALLIAALIMLSPGILLLYRAIRSKANHTQIYENGVVHTRGKKTRTFAFYRAADVSTSYDGNVMTMHFGLVGGLFSTVLGKSLLTFSYNGAEDQSIKRVHAYRFKRLTQDVIKAYTDYIIRNVTVENINEITLNITSKIKLEAGKFVRARALRGNVDVRLTAITRVDTSKRGSVRFKGIDETGNETDLLRIDMFELNNNEAIFWHVIKTMELRRSE